MPVVHKKLPAFNVCEENKKPLKVAEMRRQERDLSPGARPSIKDHH
jgi:hypothetical protein